MDPKPYIPHIIIGSIILIAIAAFLPASQNHIVSYGEDTYSTHKPLFSSHTAEETITTTKETVGLGAILVDLRRAKDLKDTRVEIFDQESGTLLLSQLISANSIKDDEFAYTIFSNNPISKNKKIRIVFSSPDSTIKNPTGLRFDPAKSILAISLKERIPLWQAVQTTIANNIQTWGYIMLAGAFSLICAATIFTTSKYKKAWVVILGIFLVFSFTARALIIPKFGGVSGGDAYNYLFITKAITKLQNPFANTKRLPGYPATLVPFFASGAFNEQNIMRYSQSLWSIVGIGLIVTIARTIGLSWPVALLAGTILAFQKDYYITSVRPEPYSMYTALLLASVLMFLSSYKNPQKWKFVLFGIFLGYSALTRQEGFVLAVLLGTSSLIYEGYTLYKTNWKGSIWDSGKRFLYMYGPAFIVILPFFINSAIAYGNPLYTKYLEGERLQIVHSYSDFEDAARASWGVIDSMWKSSWDRLARIPLSTPAFLSSIVLLWAWYAASQHSSKKDVARFIAIIATLAWITIIYLAGANKGLVTEYIPIVTSAWIFASIPIFIWKTKVPGIFLTIVLISQAGIALWFHPFAKHFQQSYPFIVLMIATALVSGIDTKKKYMTASLLAVFSLPFFLTASFLLKNVNAEIDQYNEGVAEDSVVYRATRAVRSMPGPIGFDQAYLPALLYFDNGEKEAKFFPGEEHPTLEFEKAWLKDNRIKTLVTMSGDDIFSNPDPSWKKIKAFKAAGKHEKIFESVIYSIP